MQIAHLKALTLHIGRASQEEAKHQICSEMMWVCGLCDNGSFNGAPVRHSQVHGTELFSDHKLRT